MGGVLLLIAGPAVRFAALAAAGVGAVWWALFGAKPRGRRRCPRCWHDLSGTPGRTCGDCGFTALREGDFARTRRRWTLAVAALLAVVAIAGWAQLSILDATWTVHVPDAVLARLPRAVPLESQPAPLVSELRDRLTRGAMGAASVEALVASVVADGRPAGAGEDRRSMVLWAATRSEPEELEPVKGDPETAISAKAAERKAHRERLAAMLDTLPPWIEVSVPARWPSGVVPAARVRGTVWGSDAEWRIRVRAPGSPWLVGENIAGLRRLPWAAAIALPEPGPDGRVRAGIDVQVRRRAEGDEEWLEWRDLPGMELDAPVAELDAARLLETNDAAVADALRECFDFPVTAWSSPERPVGIRFTTRPFGDPALSDLLVGVTVELREGDAVRRRSRMWWSGGGIDRTGWVVEHEDLPALRRLRDAAATVGGADTEADGSRALPGWTLRIAGDRATALRAIAQDRAGPVSGRVWVGALELPLRGRGTPDRAPRRIYRLELPD